MADKKPQQQDRAASPKKDPDEWTRGDEPMTSSQASYLKTLCEEAGDNETFDAGLSKAEASKRIDQMRKRVGRG
jgi:hypothetical protein